MLSTIPSLQNTALEAALKLRNISIDSAQYFQLTKQSDAIDNPLHSEPSITEQSIFKQMKFERNRLYSFQNKWPLRDIPAESLAGAGLFYLQLEDRVQCAFCYVTICNWTNGDNPLREHMRRRPKCPFLMGCEVGNVPISREKHQILQKSDNFVPERNYSTHPTFFYKPKHPRMADVKRRLLTYSGWPVSWLTPQQLAECGLYYSGIADVVTCFFCGGSLGSWERNDDPWSEHTKFFPDCAFLSVAKKRRSPSPKDFTSYVEEPKDLNKLNQGVANEMPSYDITTDIIQVAQDIFPEDVVLESVRRKGGSLLSLQELCDDILESKQEESNPLVPEDTKPKTNSNSATSQALLCVICMDRERGIAYQPCGHFVSCPSCSTKIHDCPVCRMPIIHKIRIHT